MKEFDRIRRSAAAEESVAEPVGGWSAFEDRLVGQAARSRRYGGWSVLPMALAASMALALAGWGMYLHQRDAGRASGPLATRGMPAMRPTAQEIAERAGVFDEVWEVFDRRASWVLIGDETADMGLGQASTEAPEGLLLVRLSVSRDGALFSTADLVIVPGGMAQLSIPSRQGFQLRCGVTTSATDPAHLKLRAEIGGPDGRGEPLAALASDLKVRLGQVKSAGQMVAGSGSYEGSYEVSVGLYRAEMPVQQL